jgi:deoxyribonucleoside regulator
VRRVHGSRVVRGTGRVVKNQTEILRLIEAAKMYYEQEMTQSEIASALKVSRPLVGQMLQRAKELGIVRIEIQSPLQGNKSLLNDIKAKFGLADGLIVPANRNNPDLSYRNVISQAAIFIEKKLSKVKSVGIGWGSTVSKLMETLSAEELGANKPTLMCPLIGSMTSPSIDWHPNELARRFAEKVRGEVVWLHAPAFPGTQENINRFKETEEYRLIDACWKKLDGAIVEIETFPSVPDQATAMRFGDALNRLKAVGGLLSYFYDLNGKVIKGDDDYVVRIPFESLKRIKNTLLVCAGHGNALLGALRLGIVTHLVTDDITANMLL